MEESPVDEFMGHDVGDDDEAILNGDGSHSPPPPTMTQRKRFKAMSSAAAATSVAASESNDGNNNRGSTSSFFLTGKQKGVCRIEVARVEWNTTAPWQRCPQSKSSGTGFAIDDGGRRRILTAAHVVRSAVDVRVRAHGSTRRYAAHVVVYAPDVDGALLRISDATEREEFFSDKGDGDEDKSSSRSLEFATELPALQETIQVVGFPTGGKSICITEGVVSRIDMVRASSFNHLLAIQIDAAINPGNSGGPAFDRQGLVTGVAFYKNVGRKTDNVGYLIPACVVQTFLGRCNHPQDGVYTLSPSIPYQWHPLENRSLRRAHRVPDEITGVLVTSVAETALGTDILQKGDVLTHIDGKALANDGQVVLRWDEHLPHRYLMRGKRVDETTVFTVFRNGQANQQCPPCVLRNIPSICLRWVDVDYPPDYLILGALVLLPLSWALRSHKKCGPRLTGECIEWADRWPHEWQGLSGLVILVDIMAHELTFSYSRPWRRVKSYNGTTIRSLEHLRDLWHASCQQVKQAGEGSAEPSFARIELQSDDDIVLEVREAMAAERDILRRHQIPQSFHISPPNPRYK